MLHSEVNTSSLHRDLETLLAAQQGQADKEKAIVVAALQSEIDTLKRRIASATPRHAVSQDASTASVRTAVQRDQAAKTLASTRSSASLADAESDVGITRVQQPSPLQSGPKLQLQQLSQPDRQPSPEQTTLRLNLTDTELADLELELEADAEVERAVARAEAAAAGRVGVFTLQEAAALGTRGTGGSVPASHGSDGACSPDHLSLWMAPPGCATASPTEDLRLQADLQLLQRALTNSPQSL